MQLTAETLSGNCLSTFAEFESVEHVGTTPWNRERSPILLPLEPFGNVPIRPEPTNEMLYLPSPLCPKRFQSGTSSRGTTHVPADEKGGKTGRERRGGTRIVGQGGRQPSRLLFCPSILQFRALGAKTVNAVIKFAPDRNP